MPASHAVSGAMCGEQNAWQPTPHLHRRAAVHVGRADILRGDCEERSEKRAELAEWRVAWLWRERAQGLRERGRGEAEM